MATPDKPRQILCAACKIPLEPFSDTDAQPHLACPGCGVGDSFKNIERELLQQHVKVQGQQMAKGLARSLRHAKHIKVQPKPVKQGRVRFIFDREG